MQELSNAVTVGEWYRMGAEPPFEVVAIDADHETIEIQYYDGTLQEVDFETWAEMGARAATQPEDWSGAMDLEREDYGVEVDSREMDSWNSPLDQIDQIQ